MKTCSELNLYRRHTVGCSIKSTSVKEDSPNKLKAACSCPIVASGYLEHERDASGKLKRVRHLSLGTEDWKEAIRVKGELLTRGRVEPIAPLAPVVKEEPKVITVEYAVKRYLDSRGESSDQPIEGSTRSKYRLLLQDRLVPYCAANKITDVRHFENVVNCKQFVESWQNMRKEDGGALDDETKKVHVGRLRTFLRYCIDAEWIKKSGAAKVKVKVRGEHRRYGLELNEYGYVLEAARDPKSRTHRETLVATELMRWTGMRISDAQKFREAELVRNITKTGWNADFIQKKTKKRCVSPVPDHVVAKLRALPKNANGKFFRASLAVMSDRVQTLLDKAQAVNINGVIKDRTFKHRVTPHCLRHTFAIQNLNAGVDIAIVSKWLGHESVATTQKHYRNEIESTRMLSEQIAREAVAKMLAASQAA